MNLKSGVRDYLGDFWIRIFLILALFLNLGLAAFLYFFVKSQGGLIALHYNVLWGVDYFARPLAVLKFPLIGLGLVLFNGVLGFGLWKSLKPVSFLLNLMSLICSFFLFLVGFSLYLINS